MKASNSLEERGPVSHQKVKGETVHGLPGVSTSFHPVLEGYSCYASSLLSPGLRPEKREKDLARQLWRPHGALLPLLQPVFKTVAVGRGSSLSPDDRSVITSGRLQGASRG
jgi:hypothetical protein